MGHIQCFPKIKIIGGEEQPLPFFRTRSQSGTHKNVLKVTHLGGIALIGGNIPNRGLYLVPYW